MLRPRQISGSIPQIGYAEAATGELYRRKVRIFDYTQFMAPLRDDGLHPTRPQRSEANSYSARSALCSDCDVSQPGEALCFR